MKIGLDFEKLRNPNSGLGQFAYHLAHALIEEADQATELTYYLPQGQKNIFDPTVETVSWNRYHHLLRVPIVCDVWHSIHQEAKYFPRTSAKKILTIHDLNFLHKYSGIKRDRALQRLQKLVSGVNGLAFISTFTQETCEAHLDIGNLPKRVIYNGLSIDERVGSTKPSQVDERPFLFTIGIVSEKKNFHVLVDAMHSLPNLDLYMAGNTDSAYANRIAKLIDENGLGNRIKLLGEVTEGEKNWLYQNCDAFVFPSLAEGFGLPVIEAMHYGKPTVVANSTSLPEISGGHAILLDGFNGEQIAEAIIEAIQTNTTEKQKLAKTHASSFSWNEAARSYLKFYKEIAAS